MATQKVEKIDPKILTVKSNHVVGSTYAQIVGVVVTDTDLTLEFVYKNPRPGIEEANVVARVTMPRGAGEGLVQAIQETIKDHEARKEKKNA